MNSGSTSFIQSGKIFSFNDNSAHQVHDKLPAGNYIIQTNPMTGEFFLEKVESFPLPGKLYGKVVPHTNRILSTFLDRPSGTGVVLAGEKGSGKTLLAKNISIEAAKLGIPTLIVNTPYFGDNFNKFIQNIYQPAIVLFDEFEKVYDSNTQEHMLTLLDGSFPSKKLFILTSNSEHRINTNMTNRPGRIYYMLTFKGLDKQFVKDFCEDRLKEKSHIDTLMKFSSLFHSFNFDMLQAIVEEMNRYGETPEEAVELLNTKLENSGKKDFRIVTYYKGKEIPPQESFNSRWRGNVISDSFEVGSSNMQHPLNEKCDDEDYPDSIIMQPKDIVSIDPLKGTVIYKKDDIEVVLTEVFERGYDVWKGGVF